LERLGEIVGAEKEGVGRGKAGRGGVEGREKGREGTTGIGGL